MKSELTKMKSELTRLRLAAALPFVALLFTLALTTSGARAQNAGDAPAPQETPPPPAAPRTVNEIGRAHV